MESKDKESKDKIEQIIGRFGKYQTLVVFLLTTGSLPADFQQTNVVFIMPSVTYQCMDEGAYNVTNHCPCENPVYDTSTIVNSVTSEWNLICGRTSLASLAQSMMQIGVLPGSLVFGSISDRYGRKPAVLLAQSLMTVSVMISAVITELWMFMTARFLIGVACGGTMLVSFTMLVELSGKSFRAYITGIHDISYILAYILIPMVAYFVREWRMLQLVTSVPWLVMIVNIWLLPESPRWLITVGKKERAIQTLEYIAKKNGRATQNISNLVNEIEKEIYGGERRKHVTYLDLFKTPKIRLYSFINAFVWLCCAHTAFGMNQYIGRLQGNIYLNVLLSALLLIPAIIAVVVAFIHFQRRITVTTTFIFTGICLLCFIAIPNSLQWLSTAFAILGTSGAFAVFASIYLYTSEIFPTVIRNSAMGFASVFARLGSFCAPFVVNIGVEWISILIFSALAFCGGILCCFLPETKETVLLNTVEQTEQCHGEDKETT